MKRLVHTVSIIVALVVVGTSAAQAQVVSASPGLSLPLPPITLTGGTIHTVEGEVIEDGVIVVDKDGRIAHVGARGTGTPQGRTIDVSGKLVTPGLIDGWTRLGLHEVSAVDSTRDERVAKRKINAGFVATDGFHWGSVVVPHALTGGVTSVIVAPQGGLVSGQAGWVELERRRGVGKVIDPSVLMHIRLGAGGAKEYGGARGMAVAQLRRLYEDVRYYAKNRAAFDQNRARKLTANPLDLRALNSTLTTLPVAFSGHRASDITTALTLARELGVKPVIVGGAEAWMVADELAAAKVPVVMHPMSNLPSNFDALGHREDGAALLEQNGVAVVLSTFDVHNVRNLRQLAGNAVRAGMSHAGALRAVTLTPAEMAGMATDYGSISKGKRANLVVWSGDPFEHSTTVDSVYIGGIKTSTLTRQKRLLQRYRTLERRQKPPTPAELRGDSDGEAKKPAERP